MSDPDLIVDDDPEGRELAANEPADAGFIKSLCIAHCIRRFPHRKRHCVRGKYYQFASAPPKSHFSFQGDHDGPDA